MCCGGEGRVQSTHDVGISRAPASIDESFSRSHVRLQIRLLTVVIVTPPLLALPQWLVPLTLSPTSWRIAGLCPWFSFLVCTLFVGDLI